MTLDLFNLVSVVLGLIGSWLVFRYGIPSRIDTGGKTPFVCIGIDENEKKEIAKYMRCGNIGILLIMISFLFQLPIALGVDYKVPAIKIEDFFRNYFGASCFD